MGLCSVWCLRRTFRSNYVGHILDNCSSANTAETYCPMLFTWRWKCLDFMVYSQDLLGSRGPTRQRKCPCQGTESCYQPSQPEDVWFLSARLPSLKCDGHGRHFTAALRICWKNLAVIQKSPVTERETCTVAWSTSGIDFVPVFVFFSLKNQTKSVMQLVHV